MKLLQGIFEIFNLVFSDDYDDPYIEHLSEQPGTYISLKDV